MAYYKVVPFSAVIQPNQGAGHAASQLDALIEQHAGHGFEYVRMEIIPTFVPGDNGCFGIGARPSTTRSYPVVVFKMPTQ